MKRLIEIALALVLASVAIPAMAQQKAPDPITPKSVCDRIALAKQIIFEDSKTGERRGHPMVIRALKDAKRISLPVRKLAPECLEGSDWRVNLGDDEQIRNTLRYHTEQAIKAGFDVTRLLTPEELNELAASNMMAPEIWTVVS